jgi:hypothetical protein
VLVHKKLKFVTLSYSCVSWRNFCRLSERIDVSRLITIYLNIFSPNQGTTSVKFLHCTIIALATVCLLNFKQAKQNDLFHRLVCREDFWVSTTFCMFYLCMPLTVYCWDRTWYEWDCYSFEFSIKICFPIVDPSKASWWCVRLMSRWWSFKKAWVRGGNLATAWETNICTLLVSPIRPIADPPAFGKSISAVNRPLSEVLQTGQLAVAAEKSLSSAKVPPPRHRLLGHGVQRGGDREARAAQGALPQEIRQR